jgi:bifunctional non-homologous end joining protein LigD
MARRSATALPLIEPVIPERLDRPFDDPAWLFEPKYDGFRGILYVTRRDCHFRSKRGNLLRRFQDLCHWVRQELPVKEVILDGEIVALDPEGRQDFRALLENRGNLHYAAFDVLWLRGRDLRPLPLARRKRVLHRIVQATSTVLSQAFALDTLGRDMLAAAERLDLEGIVAKRKADPYGPETVWYKIRNQAYTQAEGRWELFRRP